MKTENQITTTPEKKGFEYSPAVKRGVTIICTVLFILPFFIYGVAEAYDAWLYNYLESNLLSQVENKKSVRALAEKADKDCDAAYGALLKHKEESKMKIEGTGNPCSF